jgi:hypothetical protein
LLSEHGREWAGPQMDWVQGCLFRRGFVGAVKGDPDVFLTHDGSLVPRPGAEMGPGRPVAPRPHTSVSGYDLAQRPSGPILPEGRKFSLPALGLHLIPRRDTDAA